MTEVTKEQAQYMLDTLRCFACHDHLEYHNVQRACVHSNEYLMHACNLARFDRELNNV